MFSKLLFQLLIWKIDQNQFIRLLAGISTGFMFEWHETGKVLLNVFLLIWVGLGYCGVAPLIPSLVQQPSRNLTYISLKKGKRKSVKSVVKRFMRLHCGLWIRRKVMYSLSFNVFLSFWNHKGCGNYLIPVSPLSLNWHCWFTTGWIQEKTGRSCLQERSV